MKTLLVAINSKFIHTNLAVRYLKKALEDEGYSCDIYESNINAPFGQVLCDILENNYDFIGFSAYIFNKDFVLKLMSDVKKVTNAKLFVGGGEVLFDCDDFLPYADFVLQGEGEKAIVSLVKGEISEKVTKCTPLAPSEFLSLKNTGYYENDPGKIHYYESSRGCPFSCSYCQSGDDAFRFLEIEEVSKDLKYFSTLTLEQVKFVDRTFNANKSRSVAILKEINALKTDTNFHFEIAADLVTDEFVEEVAKSKEGQFQFEIGIQSFNGKTLEAIDRKTDLPLVQKNISRLVETNKSNIHIDLIAGLPFEDLESFKESFNLAFSLGAHMLQLGFLKVLRGSKIAKQTEEFGICHSSHPPYEVLKTNYLSAKDILVLKQVEKALDMFHGDKPFTHLLSFVKQKFNSPFALFARIGTELNKHKGNMSLWHKIGFLYKLFAPFGENEVEALIRFDYLILCKDKVIKSPLKNCPPKSHGDRHKKDKFIQHFDIDPLTLQKKDCCYEFDYSKACKVTGKFSFEKVE